MDNNGAFVPFGEAGTDTSDGTITANTVLAGYVGYSKGERIVGSYIPLDTSDADATESDIQYGKSAYVNGVKIIGTASSYQSISKYSGSIPVMSEKRLLPISGSIGNHIIVGGGSPIALQATSSVDIYTKSFTKSIGTSLSDTKENATSTKIGDYLLFIGGYDPQKSESLYSVDYFVTSLTKGLAPNLTKPRHSEGKFSVSIGNFSLIHGGQSRENQVTNYLSSVETYSKTLTKGTAPDLSESGGSANAASGSIGNYAIIAIGQTTGTPWLSNVVNAYSKELTRSILQNLSFSQRGFMATECANNYLLFAGGSMSSDSTTNVDCYNTSLTKSSLTNFPDGKAHSFYANLRNYAIFSGGYNTNGTSLTTLYTNSTILYVDLVQQFGPSLNRGCIYGSSCTLDNYAIFSGGTRVTNDMQSQGYTDVIEAYYCS